MLYDRRPVMPPGVVSCQLWSLWRVQRAVQRAVQRKRAGWPMRSQSEVQRAVVQRGDRGM